MLLATTGLNYSTIAVLSLQPNLGRLRNEKAHIQKQIALENVDCCYVCVCVCERFAIKGQNLQKNAHRPPALHSLRSNGRAVGTEEI